MNPKHKVKLTSARAVGSVKRKDWENRNFIAASRFSCSPLWSKRANGDVAARGAESEAFADGLRAIIVAGPHQDDVAGIRVVDAVSDRVIRPAKERASAAAVGKGGTAIA